MGCPSFITLSTSWWLFFPLSSMFVLFSYFVLILLDGKGAAALSSSSTCCAAWRTGTYSLLFISSDVAEVLSQY